MLGYVAAGIGIFVVGKTLWMIDDWKRDWTSNHAVLADSQADANLHPILTDRSPDEVASVVRRWVADQSHWDVVDDVEETENPAILRLHLTHATSVFRFIDDVHVEIHRLERENGESKTVFHAESRSRVGKGDLGQNPRNLKMLRKGVLSGLKTISAR